MWTRIWTTNYWAVTHLLVTITSTQHIKEFASIRKQHPALQSGEQTDYQFDDANQVFAFTRTAVDNSNKVTLVFNASTETRTVSLNASQESMKIVGGNGTRGQRGVTLPKLSFVVLKNAQ
jgi:glycosidase